MPSEIYTRKEEGFRELITDQGRKIAHCSVYYCWLEQMFLYENNLTLRGKSKQKKQEMSVRRLLPAGSLLS